MKQKVENFFTNDIGIKNRKDLFRFLVGIAVAFIAAIILNLVCSSLIFKKSSGYCGYVLWISVCLIVFILYEMRSVAIRRMEVLFALATLIMGTFYIAVSPATVGVSWDDQLHYGSTVSALSYLTGGSYNKADEDDIASVTEIAASFADQQQRVGLSRQGRKALSDRLNAEYRSGEPGNNIVRSVTFQAIGYIPGGIGIAIGRLIRLPWTACFNLGRFFTLLSYVTVISIAINRLKHGKLFCALIGMIPTSVFMASSYSYDPWVISWSIWGFAEFFRLISDTDHKITNHEWRKMLLIFFVAFLPKMVYVVTLFPLLFVRSDRFENRKQAVILKAWVLIVAVILAIAYAGPEMLKGSLLVGDTRGWDSVNPVGQVSYMLHNPIRAGRIIIDFAIRYAGLNIGDVYLQKFAYLGNGGYEILAWVVIVLGVAMEEKDETWCPGLIRISGVIGIILGVFAVIFSMYVAFSPVGSSVQGVQNRYIFPLLFPLFYYLKPETSKQKWISENHAVYPVAFMAFTFIYNVYAVCVTFY